MYLLPLGIILFGLVDLALEMLELFVVVLEDLVISALVHIII